MRNIRRTVEVPPYDTINRTTADRIDQSPCWQSIRFRVARASPTFGASSMRENKQQTSFQLVNTINSSISLQPSSPTTLWLQTNHPSQYKNNTHTHKRTYDRSAMASMIARRAFTTSARRFAADPALKQESKRNPELAVRHTYLPTLPLQPLLDRHTSIDKKLQGVWVVWWHTTMSLACSLLFTPNKC